MDGAANTGTALVVYDIGKGPLISTFPLELAITRPFCLVDKHAEHKLFHAFV